MVVCAYVRAVCVWWCVGVYVGVGVGVMHVYAVCVWWCVGVYVGVGVCVMHVCVRVCLYVCVSPVSVCVCVSVYLCWCQLCAYSHGQVCSRSAQLLLTHSSSLSVCVVPGTCFVKHCMPIVHHQLWPLYMWHVTNRAHLVHMYITYWVHTYYYTYLTACVSFSSLRYGVLGVHV